MKADAPLRDIVSNVLLGSRVPLTLRQITNRCPLQYQQVTSVLGVLYSRGLVRRVHWGLYEATDELRSSVLSPEAQVQVLKARVAKLEDLLKKVLRE